MDDGKIIVELRTDTDSDEAQDDINKIINWCKIWSMELSPEKCKVMHMGSQLNPKSYFVAEKRVDITKCEKNLGVIISAEGRLYEQVCAAAS